MNAAIRRALPATSSLGAPAGSFVEPRRGKKTPHSRTSRFFNLFECLELRLAGVMLVQWVTAADQAVAGRSRAVAERPTDRFGIQGASFHGIRQHRRIRQDHAS